MPAICKPRDWLTAQILRDLLSYDPTTGLLRWRNPAGRWGRIPAGSIAGSVSKIDGYRHIGLGGNGKTIHSSHLVWLYVTGDWPPLAVDHRNGVKDDDRWENLRLATDAQNKANSGLYKSNKTGVTGVVYREDCPGRPWRAVIRVKGKLIRIGSFLTKDEAIAARKEAQERYFGEFERVA